MKRIISLFLILTSCLFYSFSLVSCFKEDAPPITDGNGDGDEGKKIKLPAYKDYGRGTVDFGDIEYVRPDVEGTIPEFDRVTELIEKNEVSFEEQVSAITALEDVFTEITTAASYTNLRCSMDTKSEYWNGEYEYVSGAYPAFSQALERLFVAAATSPHAERFENEYFGDGLIEEYADGGDITDALVLLMEDEAALISRYTELSHSTVEITYDGRTATYDVIAAELSEKHGEGSRKYRAAIAECDALYAAALEEATVDILIELFKVRRDIADELKLESYASYAYENIYHDYTEEDYLKFSDDIIKYVTPVYATLSAYVFEEYDYTDVSKLGRVDLINGAGDILKKTDGELYEIYSYMLQHSLYDVNKASDARFEGAFTTYLEKYSAPFLFFSTEGNSFDYSTLFHEFGHFSDAFINCNSPTSLDLSEVSSQALELMMLTKMRGEVKSKDVELQRIYLLENALSALLFQGFYAAFEHIAYAIPGEDISKESLDAAVSEAAEAVGLRSDVLSSVSYVLIPHIIRYPFYVQSYATSAAVALEIYFTELDIEGEGFAVYKDLLLRESNVSFEEHLTKVGLTSPFEDGYLMYIANRVYYELTGYNYFTEGESAA